MAEKKKYYWLKLKRDFFKRHDIRIVESMPNGKDYILFYLKLLLESIDHEGTLRFSETIPYNEHMLSVVTNTNIDTVKSAMKLFIELNMMTVFDDKTIYMNEVDKLIGSETANAERVRKHRALKSEVLHCNALVTKCNTEIDKEKDKETETDLKKEDNIPSSSNPAPAPKHKHGEYSHVKLTDEEHHKLELEYGSDLTGKAITHLDEYIEMKGYKAKSHYLAIRKWVIDAVNEKAQKALGKEPKPRYGNFDTEEAFQKAIERSYGG